VWYNSRFYRANLLWEKGNLRFRDIHVFDEEVESNYLRKQGKSTKCDYYTLPVMDGFQWSSGESIAGIRFKQIVDGKEVEIKGGEPEISEDDKGGLQIIWPSSKADEFMMISMDEANMKISAKGNSYKGWFLEFGWSDEKEVPFKNIIEKKIEYSYKGNSYFLTAKSGSFTKKEGSKIQLTANIGEIALALSK